ncbi:hypothetical protein ACM40_08075 [Chryseobacterium sp. BLS98]|jgi:Mg2+ and Co2+ transporter CorA|uniref:hypothetical protein n=1 Tax=Chryseobacterium sp. BLS98 TaxID=885586 RepID=UPI00065AFD86|nr:hypothetical protein [Chryseobacterium sp. BLS98]KMQ62252.1 hypothetical protein ACM40_08075 [Chryseobacterium sp. BLS98]
MKKLIIPITFLIGLFGMNAQMDIKTIASSAGLHAQPTNIFFYFNISFFLIVLLFYDTLSQLALQCAGNF